MLDKTYFFLIQDDGVWRETTFSTFVLPGSIGYRAMVKMKSHQDRLPGVGSNTPLGSDDAASSFKPKPTRFAFDGNSLADVCAANGAESSASTLHPGMRIPASRFRFGVHSGGFLVVRSPSRFVKDLCRAQYESHWCGRKVMVLVPRLGPSIFPDTLDPVLFGMIRVPDLLKPWQDSDWIFGFHAAFRIRQAMGPSWTSMSYYSPQGRSLVFEGIPSFLLPPLGHRCPFCGVCRGVLRHLTLHCGAPCGAIDIRKAMFHFVEDFLVTALGTPVESVEQARSLVGQRHGLLARVRLVGVVGDAFSAEFPVLSSLGWGASRVGDAQFGLAGTDPSC